MDTIKEYLSDYWFLILILIIGAYFFLNETRSINKQYRCNFDVFFTNWDEESGKLLKKEIALKEPYTIFPWNKQRIEDAQEDLKKQAYLPAERIREAKRIIEDEKRSIKYHYKNKKEGLERIKLCREYIKQKSAK